MTVKDRYCCDKMRQAVEVYHTINYNDEDEKYGCV